MAGKKKTEEQAEQSLGVSEATEQKLVEPACTEAQVHTQQGAHVRTFTKDIHGDKFLEFAHEFAKPRGFDVREH